MDTSEVKGKGHRRVVNSPIVWVKIFLPVLDRVGVKEHYLFVVREVVAPPFHHVSGWCTCILFSLFCGLQPSTEFGAGRTKRVKPVVVYEGKTMRCLYRSGSCISTDLFWSGKRLGGCDAMWSAGVSRGAVTFFFFFFFSFISLIADGPPHYHPACGH